MSSNLQVIQDGKHYSTFDKDQHDEIELLRCCRRRSPSCEVEADKVEADNVEDRKVEVEEKGSGVKDQSMRKVKNTLEASTAACIPSDQRGVLQPSTYSC
jgi:hypothetical protein